MIPGVISSVPFVPHSFAHIEEAKVFPPGAVPEVSYQQMVDKYHALKGLSVQRIVYKSDGLNITGLAALPDNLKPSPILIYNRGGSGEYGKLTVFSAMRSMVPFAQAGYIVFATNYRGNDGGEGSEEFGGADVHDVVNLLSLARQNPAWDGKNAFMLGHSRGGMMTSLAMKAGAELSAATILAGVSDLLTDLRIEPRMEELYRRRVPGYAENPEVILRSRSSLCWPEAISAPLLLLHGMKDEVVSHTQSEMLASALQRLGKPHGLHLYPEGNHALVRAWDDVLKRTLGWFEEHKA